MSGSSGGAPAPGALAGERGPAGYVRPAMRRHGWLIIASTVLLTALAVTVGLRAGIVYEASASALLNPLRGNPYSTEDRGDDLANLETEAQLVTGDAVIALARDELDTELTDEELRRAVSIEVPTNTQLLVINFTAGSAESARDGAQIFAESYLEYRRSRAGETVDNQLTTVDSRLSTVRDAFDTAAAELAGGDVDDAERAYLEERVGTLAAELSDLEAEQSALAATDLQPGSIISPAELPPAPSGLPVSVFVAGGALIGLLIGVGLAVARAQTDSRLHDRAAVERLGVATLVTVPRAQRLTSATPWIDSEPSDSTKTPAEPADDAEPASDERPALPEAYRALRTRIVSTLPPPPVVVGLAAAHRDATTAPEATALAIGLAMAGFEVALVDATGDVAPGLVGGTNEPGLAELLTGRAVLPDVVGPVAHNLGVIPIGADAGAARERLLSSRMRRTVDSLRLRCDYVIFAGARADSADGQAIASLGDTMVLVVPRQQTTRAELLEAVDAVRRIDGSVLGAVLVESARTDTPPPTPRGPVSTPAPGVDERGRPDDRAVSDPSVAGRPSGS